MFSYLFLNGQRLIIIACEQALFLGKGWKNRGFTRCWASKSQSSSRPSIRSVFCGERGGILKVIRDSSNRTCLYISYCGEDIFLWTAKQSKPITFRETKLSESNVSKPGEMSVDDLFKKESLLTKFHILPSLWTGSLFGERVKKSQSEGRKGACRQTPEAVVPRHSLSITSWFKLLLARTLTVDRFDLHRFFSRHVARDLI